MVDRGCCWLGRCCKRASVCLSSGAWLLQSDSGSNATHAQHASTHNSLGYTKKAFTPQGVGMLTQVGPNCLGRRAVQPNADELGAL